jgi:hypothetical protein
MLFVRMAENEPVKKEQKESSKELFQVKTTSGQDGIHTSPFFLKSVYVPSGYPTSDGQRSAR